MEPQSAGLFVLLLGVFCALLDQGMTRDRTAAAMTELVGALHPGEPAAHGQRRDS